MKTSVTNILSRRICLLILSVFSSVAAFSAAGPDYDFRNSVLIGGVDNQVGAIYRFPYVKPNVDAIVTITKITGGLTLTDIDGSSGFTEALQPVINIPGHSSGYAEFRIDFVLHNTILPALQLEVPITAIDVDGKKAGGNTVNEFDMIQILPQSFILFNGASPELQLGFLTGWVTGTNTSGIDYPGVDTVAKQVMFSVVNAAAISLKVRVGATNNLNSTEQRLRSFYFKKFIFPNSVLPTANLLSFTGNAAEKNCKLQWTLNADNNATEIVLERGATATSFSPVAEFLVNFDGQQQHDFNYTDNTAGSAVYYRLKIVSASGKVEYSNILNFKAATIAGKNLKVYPTLIDKNATVSVKADKSQTALLQWTDMSGKIMQQQMLTLQKGTNSLQLSRQANLPRGNYIIAVMVDNKMLADRVIVQ